MAVRFCGYIPALNDDHKHIEALGRIIKKHLQGWLGEEVLRNIIVNA